MNNLFDDLRLRVNEDDGLIFNINVASQEYVVTSKRDFRIEILELINHYGDVEYKRRLTEDQTVTITQDFEYTVPIGFFDVPQEKISQRRAHTSLRLRINKDDKLTFRYESNSALYMVRCKRDLVIENLELLDEKDEVQFEKYLSVEEMYRLTPPHQLEIPREFFKNDFDKSLKELVKVRGELEFADIESHELEDIRKEIDNWELTT